jgi:hypothetical protein
MQHCSSARIVTRESYPPYRKKEAMPRTDLGLARLNLDPSQRENLQMARFHYVEVMFLGTTFDQYVSSDKVKRFQRVDEGGFVGSSNMAPSNGSSSQPLATAASLPSPLTPRTKWKSPVAPMMIPT